MLTCKGCGKTIVEDALDLHVFIEARGTTVYESWSCADYCEDCASKIARTVPRFIPMIEQSCMIRTQDGGFDASNDELLLSVLRKHLDV